MQGLQYILRGFSVTSGHKLAFNAVGYLFYVLGYARRNNQMESK